jgi:hypothetical protein
VIDFPFSLNLQNGAKNTIYRRQEIPSEPILWTIDGRLKFGPPHSKLKVYFPIRILKNSRSVKRNARTY